MPNPKDVVVRVQALDGTWETCGADRARGVVPENVQLVSDQWGSKTASFDLRRDPKAIWPDISAFAPVEVEVGGRLVWSGRVAETPVRDSTDSVISVQCEGWQAHLDDDLYERIYVHTNLGDWRDARGDAAATLSTLVANWQVTTGDGKISLMCPQGTSPSGRAAVVLDLGPNSTAKRVVVNWSITARQAASGNRAFYFASSTTSGDAGGSPTLSTINSGTTATSGTYTKTITDASRYLFLAYDANTYGSACTADDGVTITSVQVFADTAYESSNASILKADQVVKDALTNATLLLNSDQSAVEAGTFNIPELAPSEPKTPREMWNAVDAFEDRYKKIDVLKRPIYKAKPTTPEVEVGAWSGMEFEDSSSNSGDDIYNRVLITGTKADGTPLRIERYQSIEFGNKSFTVDTTNWTTNTKITRDTATFYSSPASGRWDKTGASDNLTNGDTLDATAYGTLKSGTVLNPRRYVLKVVAKASLAPAAVVNFNLTYDNGGGAATLPGGGDTSWLSTNVTLNRSWVEYAFPFTVFGGTDYNNIQLRLLIGGAGTYGAYIWIDSVTLSESPPTIIDRRAFFRCKQIASSFTLTDTAGQQIAEKWLLSHKTSPFKGRAKLTGNQAIRDIKTGRDVPPEEMLLRTGELIRFGDRIDPDTGATGRDGRLVEAQYNADEDSTNLTIDSSRAGFEALLERLGVVLGQNRFS